MGRSENLFEHPVDFDSYINGVLLIAEKEFYLNEDFFMDMLLRPAICPNCGGAVIYRGTFDNKNELYFCVVCRRIYPRSAYNELERLEVKE